ncbi:MAG TPA: nuclear transport factor 2 family protein [Phycisphaerae bacterium]|nr:nuclear transport factor 2 family protein [Phycisphaerae bacterium]
MTTADVGKRLVEFCRQGQFKQAIDALYSPDIVSVEAFEMPASAPGPRMPREMRGIQQVRGKTEWWEANHTVNSANVSGPFISLEKFAVIFDMDITVKATGKGMKMKEVAIYTVANDKIVHEEFLYDTSGH